MTPGLLFTVVACLLSGTGSTRYTEEELGAYLSGDYEMMASALCHQMQVYAFDHATDLLNETKTKLMQEQLLKNARFEKDQWLEYWKDADWENFKDDFVKRQLKFLSKLGDSALDDKSLAKMEGVMSSMMTIYSTAKVCPYHHQHCDLKKEGMPLSPNINNRMEKSRDYDELAYLWKAWRDATGAKMREDYREYVKLSNQAATLNGFPDAGSMWRYTFEMQDFSRVLHSLWAQVEPLYLSLHGYVRGKLHDMYGDRVGDDGLIPAHLLGNMWAQSWVAVYDRVMPYPEASLLDMTSALQHQNYTPLRMFRTADDFYMSLGMVNNAMSYDESKGAVITKPRGKEAVCHASAWDLCDRKDFRIKMCTEVNAEDFVTIHHEMGHIQYFQQYKGLPLTFRTSVNPGFTEAVGDTIALSVSTPEHLQKIGLLHNYQDSDKDSINALMKAALAKVAFLPFGLLVDLFRWDVFAGRVPESMWNHHWWKLREEFQRVKPPVPRTERDFDPGSKYHVTSGSMYISYFLSYILQFQLHKALCVTAGEYNPSDPSSKPLHKCDIFRSKEAGSRLAEGLSLGKSKHWTEVLHILTGERKFDGSAMLEYFAPLRDFLDQQPTRELANNN